MGMNSTISRDHAGITAPPDDLNSAIQWYSSKGRLA